MLVLLAASPLLAAGDALSTLAPLAPSDREDGMHYGNSVAFAGDVDGDGFDDVLVGAHAAGGIENIGVGIGAAYLYAGSAWGVDPDREQVLSVATADEAFAWSLSAAGDVNADGYDDVLIGSWRVSQDEDGYWLYGAGSAHLFFGSAVGLADVPDLTLTTPSGDDWDVFAFHVSAAGDVDGDGYDDVLVGAYSDDEAGEQAGAAYLYRGGAEGLSEVPDQKLTASEGVEEGWLGFHTAPAGDLNGDGYDDVVIGAPASWSSTDGAAHVFFGSAAGLTAAVVLTPPKGCDDGRFGEVSAGVGDLNGDGYDDLVVTAKGQTPDRGCAVFYPGGADELGAPVVITPQDRQVDGRFGDAVAGVGDLDGDGYDDLVITAPQHNDIYRGTALLFTGSAEGPVEAGELKPADLEDYDYYGGSVDGRGDVDGDGVPDVVIGAFGSGGSWSGDAFVFSACQTAPWPADADGDGFGDPDASTEACSPPPEHVDNTEDCDDTDANTHPDAEEVCDDIDNDCDGEADDDATDAATWHIDYDGDGDGTTSLYTLESCEPPPGYTDNADDCDDTDAAISAAAEEVCDGIDNNCDGEVDPACAADEAPARGPTDTGCHTSARPASVGLFALAVLLLVSRRQRRDQPPGVAPRYTVKTT